MAAMARRTAGTAAHVATEARYSAHNYAPLDVVVARAHGVWVWDVDDRRYMDFLSAYSAVNQGHCHPAIVAALEQQARKLTLTSRAFRNDRFGAFCEKLATLLGYDKVLMMNTGAEAVETAIKAARKWGYERRGVPDESAEIMVFENNFHGRTTTIVGFSSDETARRGFGPFAPGFRTARFGDLESVRDAWSEHVVALLVEPIQGEAGVVIPPDDFLPGLRELCDRHRALLICDEIQSGLGRAGALLAHNRAGVRADAVLLGKALSGGMMPVSAFLADDDVMGVFTPGTHGSTYGGNPLACAVAQAALDVILGENLCERSEELGAHMLKRLRAIRSPRIVDVRGAGLWAGVELAPEVGGARGVCEALRAEGVLCKETHVHTLRLAPPLVIQREELDWALDRIEGVLAAL